MKKLLVFLFVLGGILKLNAQTIPVNENDFERIVTFIKKNGSPLKYQTAPGFKYTFTDNAGTLHSVYLMNADKQVTSLDIESYLNGRDHGGDPVFFWKIKKYAIVAMTNDDGLSTLDKAYFLTKEDKNLKNGYPIAKRAWDILLNKSK